MPKTKIKPDQFRIGGESDTNVTQRYFVGYNHDGYMDVDSVEPFKTSMIGEVLHVADVTMPHLRVMGESEHACFVRDEILGHYGLEAMQTKEDGQ